jgi:hypothetical protein
MSSVAPFDRRPLHAPLDGRPAKSRGAPRDSIRFTPPPPAWRSGPPGRRCRRSVTNDRCLTDRREGVSIILAKSEPPSGHFLPALIFWSLLYQDKRDNTIRTRTLVKSKAETERLRLSDSSRHAPRPIPTTSRQEQRDNNKGIQPNPPTYTPNRLNTASGIARTTAMITRQIPGV